MWKHIIQYNRGGSSGPFFVAKDLSETTDRAVAKQFEHYDEAVAFCQQPDFATKYGKYWGVILADEELRQVLDQIGCAILRPLI